MYTFIVAESRSFTDWVVYLVKNNFDLFVYGIQITLLLAIVGTVVGLLIGLLVGVARSFEVDEHDTVLTKVLKRVMHALIGIYLWFFRGTPMMVQAMLFYYGLYPVLHWNPLTAGLIIISINTGAYMAEIVRSGIQSVDNGQREGARSIGMSNVQTMMLIILPQAVKNSLPSIGNQFIVNIKDSSMLNVIGVIDLYFQTSSVGGSASRFSEAFFIASLVYLTLTSLATLTLNVIEKSMNKTPKPVESEQV